MLGRKRAELMYRGVDQMEIEQNIATLRQASAGEAIRETKLFILQKVAEDRGVQIQQAEIEGAIAQMAFRRASARAGSASTSFRTSRSGPLCSRCSSTKHSTRSSRPPRSKRSPPPTGKPSSSPRRTRKTDRLSHDRRSRAPSVPGFSGCPT